MKSDYEIGKNENILTNSIRSTSVRWETYKYSKA